MIDEKSEEVGLLRSNKFSWLHEEKKIWIVGEGKVLYPVIQAKRVNEFNIQIAPSIIGGGIPLFFPGNHENELTFVDVRRYRQFAEMHDEIKSTKQEE